MIDKCSLTLWAPEECAVVWWSNTWQVLVLRNDRWQKGWTLACVSVMVRREGVRRRVSVMVRRGRVSGWVYVMVMQRRS
jgi:hypothetical protein